MTHQTDTQDRRTRAYVNEAYRQIELKPDIMDIVILNRAGVIVRTSMESNSSIQFSGLYGNLLEKVESTVKKLDPKDEPLMVRVRTKNGNETVMIPDGDITILVIQNCQDKINMN